MLIFKLISDGKSMNSRKNSEWLSKHDIGLKFSNIKILIPIDHCIQNIS